MANRLGTVWCLALAIITGSPLLAIAQIAVLVEAEKSLALQLKCEDYKKNADGTWTSGPTTRIGTTIFTNNRFGLHNVMVGGVDLAYILDKKCNDVQLRVAAPEAHPKAIE